MILVFFAIRPALQTYPRRLFLLTHGLFGTMTIDRFSWPVRWRLLDFMSAVPPASRLPPPAPPPPPPRTSTASARSQCSPGPDQQPLEQSVPRRTSTASSRSQRSPPDPNSNLWIKVIPPAGPRKFRIRVFPAGPPAQAPDQSVPRGPQPRAPDQNVPRRTSTTENLRRYTR